jgi:hypothetical protein
MRWRSVAGGYLALVVLWTLGQRAPSDRLGGLANDLTRVMRRLFDPAIAGIPDHAGVGYSTDINQTYPPGDSRIPHDAGPPSCPAGTTARWDPLRNGKKGAWTCLTSETTLPGGGGNCPPGTTPKWDALAGKWQCVKAPPSGPPTGGAV